MSKESIKIVNKIYRGFITVISVALAIVALKYNPGHLFTAGLLYAFGINTEIISPDEADIF